MQILRRYLSLLALEKKDIYQLFFYALFSGLISLSLPLGIQAIVNFIQSGRLSASWILLVVMVVVGVAFMGYLAIMQLRITETLQQKIFIRSSMAFAYRLPRIQMEALRDTYPPQLANKFFDTLGIQKGTSKLLLDFSAALLQIAFGLILLTLYHPLFILFGLILLGLLYFIFAFSFKKGLETSIKESKNKYKVVAWLQEMARNTFSFRREDHLSFGVKKTDALVQDYLSYREKHFSVIKRQYAQLVLFKIIVTAGLLVLGGMLVINNQMNVGQFVASEIVILMVINSVEKIILGLETFYDVLTSVDKMAQVVDLPIEPEAEIRSEHSPEHYTLEAREAVLDFSGQQGKMIGPISVSLRPGERVGLVGENGSGKSALLKMLGGFLQPHQGSMLVYDHHLQQVPLQEFRTVIGTVMSGDTPFEGSLWENLTFCQPEANAEAVKWAVELVGLADYLKGLPLGYDTPILAEGRQLPTSIAQKIVLARAIVHRPKWLFLESPLSQLDRREAEQIVTRLAQSYTDGSWIVNTRSPLWTPHLTRTITLEHGQIINDITH